MSRTLRHELPRVAFIAHGLVPGCRSFELTEERLNDLGRSWAKKGEDPGYIKWFSFPVVAKDPSLSSVWFDHYVIPATGPDFFEATLGPNAAYDWVERVALDAFAEAEADKVPLTIAWGAFTKNATDHGATFVKKHPALASRLATTHGDAGTVHFVLEMIRLAGIKPGFRVAVVGASGVIGDLLARTLPSLDPRAIILVGRPDKEGRSTNRQRLEATASEVHVPNGEVIISQDALSACRVHRADLVIVATNGDDFPPEAVLPGTVVLDITTPAACRPSSGWRDRLVLAAGSGQLDPALLPESFGTHRGSALVDVGGGGSYCGWGCWIEPIMRAMKGWRGHVAGKKVGRDALEWCQEAAREVGFSAADPMSFEAPLTWAEVQAFVRQAPERRAWSSTAE